MMPKKTCYQRKKKNTTRKKRRKGGSDSDPKNIITEIIKEFNEQNKRISKKDVRKKVRTIDIKLLFSDAIDEKLNIINKNNKNYMKEKWEDNIVDYIWEKILNKNKIVQRYYFTADGKSRKNESGQKLRRATHFENMIRTIKKQFHLKKSNSTDDESNDLPLLYKKKHTIIISNKKNINEKKTKNTSSSIK